MELFEEEGAVLIPGTEIYRSVMARDDRPLRLSVDELGDMMSGGTMVTNWSSQRFPSLRDSSRTEAGMAAIYLGQSEWPVIFLGEGGPRSPRRATLTAAKRPVRPKR